MKKHYQDLNVTGLLNAHTPGISPVLVKYVCHFLLLNCCTERVTKQEVIGLGPIVIAVLGVCLFMGPDEDVKPIP